MSLYLKYRPSELSQVRGNEETVSTLEKMLSDIKTCPHSFLLHGPTGCGKTTLGRIIGSTLGCIGNDFREVDSADFRGIDTIREIRKNSAFMPLEGACRVWLIDECHKMTNDAQNALLKILEDTPKHVFFILCTTEPQKLIATIKGRCQQFQVKTLNEIQLTTLIKRIARSEGESLNPEIIEYIVQNSLGHPRNAIQALEQILTAPTEDRLKIAKQSTQEQAQTIELCRALFKPAVKWKEVNTILNGLKDIEPEEIRRQILGYFSAVLLKEDNQRAGLILEQFWEPLYNTGFPGLVYCCYSIVKSN